MCYNCGCEEKNNDMGKGIVSKGGASLTEEDFSRMAEVWGMDVTEAKRNTLNLLKKEIEKKEA